MQTDQAAVAAMRRRSSWTIASVLGCMAVAIDQLTLRSALNRPVLFSAVGMASFPLALFVFPLITAAVL
jgi:hypothetical protein